MEIGKQVGPEGSSFIPTCSSGTSCRTPSARTWAWPTFVICVRFDTGCFPIYPDGWGLSFQVPSTAEIILLRFANRCFPTEVLIHPVVVLIFVLFCVHIDNNEKDIIFCASVSSNCFSILLPTTFLICFIRLFVASR
jgi:hypothetical protein